MYFNNKKILVIVAHPDDELLGLGATMNKLIKENNCQIRAVILGEGLTSRSEVRDQEKWKKELEIHKSNITNAQRCIGYESVGIYDFPDNRFDSIALLDIVKVIEKEKKDFNPEIIFTHHGGDLNIDHQRTFEAVMTATRPMKGECVKSILTFETSSATEWQANLASKTFFPNLYIEVSKENISAKVNAMECYEYESRPYPHPRSKEALIQKARFYGSEMGIDLVERFQIIRSIQSL